jgi:hypothetical protein
LPEIGHILLVETAALRYACIGDDGIQTAKGFERGAQQALARLRVFNTAVFRYSAATELPDFIHYPVSRRISFAGMTAIIHYDTGAQLRQAERMGTPQAFSCTSDGNYFIVKPVRHASGQQITRRPAGMKSTGDSLRDQSTA